MEIPYHCFSSRAHDMMFMDDNNILNMIETGAFKQFGSMNQPAQHLTQHHFLVDWLRPSKSSWEQRWWFNWFNEWFGDGYNHIDSKLYVPNFYIPDLCKGVIESSTGPTLTLAPWPRHLSLHWCWLRRSRGAVCAAAVQNPGHPRPAEATGEMKARVILTLKSITPSSRLCNGLLLSA